MLFSQLDMPDDIFNTKQIGHSFVLGKPFNHTKGVAVPRRELDLEKIGPDGHVYLELKCLSLLKAITCT